MTTTHTPRLDHGIKAVEELQEAVERHPYDCTCQVGGVDAMSVDTDWLRAVGHHVAHDIHSAVERAEISEHEAHSEHEGRVRAEQEVAYLTDRAARDADNAAAFLEMTDARMRAAQDEADQMRRERDAAQEALADATARLASVEAVIESTYTPFDPGEFTGDEVVTDVRRALAGKFLNV